MAKTSSVCFLATIGICMTGLAANAAASCYTVYGSQGKMIFQSPDAPVDMRYPLHESVGPRFGTGATMVFTLRDEYCQSVGNAQVSTTGPTSVYPASSAAQPTVNAQSIRASVPAGDVSPTGRGSVVVAPGPARAGANTMR